MPQPDLFSSDYFAQKTRQRLAKMQPQEFEDYAEAKLRYQAEKIEPMLEAYRQYDHAEFKDFNRRRGEPMHSSDLIFKLQRLNAHICVQSQYNFPGDWGLYTTAFGRMQFITGFPKGWTHEFSYALVDDRDLPTEEKRGWRTVLVYCVMKGAITWEQAIAEFGEPNDSWNDRRWQETTADFRHGGDLVVQRNIANIVEPVV